MKEKKVQKKLQKKNLSVALILLIAIVLVIAFIVNQSQKSNAEMTPEQIRTEAYNQVQSGEDAVDGTSAVKFDAYFRNSDDENIRGTCKEIGTDSNLYMELSLVQEGTLKDATITINSDNFYFNTAILKDDAISQSYISSNTKTIKLNEISSSAAGYNKTITGTVRSGDYSSETTKTSAIGNDTNKYSSNKNTITITGTFVDSSGTPHSFTKTTEPFFVDWYGEVDAGLSKEVQTNNITDWKSLLTDEGMQLKFDAITTETKNQLIIKETHISGTIPELNGYKATSIKISGTNITYNFNAQTGEFTAQSKATVDENGIVTNNAYSYQTSNTRYTNFLFTVIYPKEAYESLGDENSRNFELKIPIVVKNEGYNNPNTQDGFTNPYISEETNSIIEINYISNLTEINEFSATVGKYVNNPYNAYVVSKEKPLNIYNGNSLEEIDDTYEVAWQAQIGAESVKDGIIMKETPNGENVLSDYIETTSGEQISMEQFTTNKGIYFNGATNALGKEGWIKVYNDETNELITIFTSNNWNLYYSSKPYIYKSNIKHIRIETSSMNAHSYFTAYNIKEIDDDYITENFMKDQFDDFAFIYTNIVGYTINQSELPTKKTEKAIYTAPTSIANISIASDTISTQLTAENAKISISTETYDYNNQNWKDGIFLIKLPTEIISVEVNNVTINNNRVNLTAYDLYEENGNYYIKILTENENAETYNIVVDCNLTPDPRITKTQGIIELYSINEIASDYYYSDTDIYDIDGDLDLTEKINHRQITLTMDPGTGLNTTQYIRDDEKTTFAPRTALIDKDRRTATITIQAINNYNFNVQDIKIQGVIPFEGNDHIITGTDLWSTYSTKMQEGGISAVTQGLEEYVTYYYSTSENPTNDINNKANGWTLKQNVKDWSAIKSYLIIIDDSYKLENRNTIEFSYNIIIPENLEYNEIAYSEHAIYYSLATETGLTSSSAASEKLGIMISKQYDLEITKFQEGTNKILKGITFKVTEEGKNTSKIKVTDASGVIMFTELYAERSYIIEEIDTTDDYELNTEKIKFYTYIDESGNFKLVTEKGYNSNLSETYRIVRKDNIISPSTSNDRYKIQLEIENKVKPKLIINATDKATNNPRQGIKFTLSGGNFNEKILTTDTNGNISVSGLYLDQEYTLTETKSAGYYIQQKPIKFTLTNNNGTIEIKNFTDDNGTIAVPTIELNDEIPTIKINFQNEKIPTYNLQITKYAKGETEEDSSGVKKDKVIQGAQYKISGEGISDTGRTYTTNEDGIITINDLYEYVDGKYITGEYSLTEIYAPEGYAVDSTTLKFKAYRENGILKIDILEGEDVIRVTDENTQDLNITDPSGTTPIVNIGVEDNQIFKIFKFATDRETQEKIPLPGTKFVITDLNGSYVTDADGTTIGEWDETLQKNVVTTDENGQLTANLREGLYKAVEVFADEKYELSANEEDRTYYFGIGASILPIYSWANSVNGQGWDYINSIKATDDGGVIAAGEFTEYTQNIDSNSENGVDLNNDGIIEEVSQGSKDGIIVAYDKTGNYKWSKTIGGTDDDSLNKIIQTSDGGYAVVGYVSSNTIYYDGKQIYELSKVGDLDNKDAILIKLDKDGNYQWGVRNGGANDDDATSIIETSGNELAIIGNYTGTFSFYQFNGTGASPSRVSSITTNYYKNGAYLAIYSQTGQYKMNDFYGTDGLLEAVDITATDSDVVVGINLTTSIYVNSGVSLGMSSSESVGMLIGYKNPTTSLRCSYVYSFQSYTSSKDSPVEISSVTRSLDSQPDIILSLEHASSSVSCTSLTSDYSYYNMEAITFTSGNSDTYDASIIDLKISGNSSRSYLTYNSVIYTLSGNYDDYISDIVSTKDGGFLLGGWYYSDDEIDVNGDGTTTGKYDLPAVTGKDTSDGFVIKLDKTRDVIYSSSLYGEGNEGVKSVAETINGNIATGGYFNTSILNATNYKFNDTGEVRNGTIIDYGKGNSNGFIVSEFTDQSAIDDDRTVPEIQYLEIENKLKTFKITTEVLKHSEGGTQVAGGNINGSEGTLEIEKVTYGENSEQEIKITPNSGYIVSSIKINDTEFTNYSTNSDGSITLPILENVTEDKHITVEFSSTIGTVEVNHFLWKDRQATTEKVKDSETLTGNVGEEYTTLPATDIKYDIITNSDFYGASLPSGLNGEDYYIPENYAGTFVAGQNKPVNYYYKYKEYTVTFNYYLEGTTQGVPNKNYADGTTIQPDVQTITIDQPYTHNFSTTVENNIDMAVYELVGNYEDYGLTEKDGQYVYEANYDNLESDLEVSFYFRTKTADLSFTKVAEEDRTETLAGTEFTLFKKKDGSTAGNDELIKASDESSWKNNWEKVNTYTTQEDGKVNLVDLPINAEYRLVETKAATGRLIASGQWKIEFMHGEYDTKDDQIITVNGTDLKITAIGNPPALAIGEDGKLQLPNREIFDFPTSGSFGSKNIYQVGLTIMALGLVILLSRKFLLVGVGVKSSQKLRNRRRNRARYNTQRQQTKETNIYKATIEEPSADKSSTKKTATRKSSTRRTSAKETSAENSDIKKTRARRTSTRKTNTEKEDTKKTTRRSSTRKTSPTRKTKEPSTEEPISKKASTKGTRSTKSTSKTRAKKGKHSE